MITMAILLQSPRKKSRGLTKKEIKETLKKIFISDPRIDIIQDST